MGLLIDTDVLVLAERGRKALDLGRYAEHGNAFISVITASELLVGVYRVLDKGVRARRLAFVEGLLHCLFWRWIWKPLVSMHIWWRNLRKQTPPNLPLSGEA